MKILKYILIAIPSILLLILSIGFIKPTIHYGHEVIVDKSKEESWAVHQDDTKYASWLKGFKSIDLISGSEGQVGSKYRVIVQPSKDQPDFEMIETIISLDKYDQITMNFDSDMMLFDQTTSFVEKDGKTSIKTESTVKGKGMMMRSVFALMEIFSGSFQIQEIENIEALKIVINNNSTDYFLNTDANMGEIKE